MENDAFFDEILKLISLSVIYYETNIKHFIGQNLFPYISFIFQ
jgi:hypothetical protein